MRRVLASGLRESSRLRRERESMEKKASAEKVIESGQGVELTVAISPTALREDAIDVTPER